MKRPSSLFAAFALALAVAGPLHARQDDIDINRLTSSLDQLSNDPVLGGYAQAEQGRARDAIGRLAQAGRSDRAHALYIAERRVDLAKTAAQLQDAQVKLNQLDREHDQILLDNSRRDARMAQRELERQRLQNQLAQEEAARLQAQGQAYSEAAQQAQAEADKARKLAAAQSRVARAAKHEAALAAQAARAMRSQLQDGEVPAAPKKPAKHPAKHPAGDH
ncbi:MAG: hypothetical protein KGM46_10615 [Pseudomonadota bacterium]|jgi:chromosome segregation ATPase|nr:hypothetical protein [Xanthomonadaceae bacterium]MDE3211183.1 hypothetical protein [Pseudomonadota bacterium]